MKLAINELLPMLVNGLMGLTVMPSLLLMSGFFLFKNKNKPKKPPLKELLNIGILKEAFTY